MNRLSVIGIAAVATVSFYTSAEAAMKFIGSVCLTAANAACNAEGWAVPQCYAMTYRPPNVDTNGPASSLTFGFGFGASNHTLASGSLVGTTFQNVTATHIFSIVRTFPAQMRFTKQTPLDLTTAKSVIITGNIQGFDVTDCNISFTAVGQRR